MTEPEFVAAKRAKRVPWQAIAKMLGRSVDDVRRTYEPGYQAPKVKALFGVSPMFKIATAVAHRHGLLLKDVLEQDRRPKIVAVRNEAFADCADAGFSSTKIGLFFRRDHSTVLHGIAKHRAGAKLSPSMSFSGGALSLPHLRRPQSRAAFAA